MTTRFKNISAFSALLLAATFLTPPNAEARPPRACEMSAVIRTVNHDKRTLSLENPHRSGPRELVWKSDTTFLRDWKVVPATELKEGTHVTVHYHSPFFGKPFLTKVVWTSGQSPEAREQQEP